MSTSFSRVSAPKPFFFFFCLKPSRNVDKIGRGWGCIYRQGSRSIMLRDTCHSYLPPATFLRLTYFGLKFFYCFLPSFFRQLLEALWYLKWVILGTVGKLEMSYFQKYQVLLNRSLDREVMSPRSRGVRAIFLCFFDEDSDQTRDVTGESRVSHRSWGYLLS